MPELIGVDDIMNQPSPRTGERIAYGDDALQFGDLRTPDEDGPHPIVMVIHGGCWRAQYDIDHIGSFSDALTKAGVATWTIEYRRVGNPGGGWPGTFEDVGAALDHLRALETEHALDLGRVVVVGHSAGGQLALWLGAHAARSVALKGVVSLAGVDDLRRALEEDVCSGMPAQLLGGTPAEVPERYAQYSPIELLPLGLPQHLINGALDPIVPEVFGKDYAAASRAAGDPTTLTIIPGAGHFELIAPATAAWQTVKEAILEMLS